MKAIRATGQDGSLLNLRGCVFRCLNLLMDLTWLFLVWSLFAPLNFLTFHFPFIWNRPLFSVFSSLNLFSSHVQLKSSSFLKSCDYFICVILVFSSHRVLFICFLIFLLLSLYLPGFILVWPPLSSPSTCRRLASVVTTFLVKVIIDIRGVTRRAKTLPANLMAEIFSYI